MRCQTPAPALRGKSASRLNANRSSPAEPGLCRPPPTNAPRPGGQPGWRRHGPRDAFRLLLRGLVVLHLEDAQVQTHTLRPLLPQIHQLPPIIPSQPGRPKVRRGRDGEGRPSRHTQVTKRTSQGYTVPRSAIPPQGKYPVVFPIPAQRGHPRRRRPPLPIGVFLPPEALAAQQGAHPVKHRSSPCPPPSAAGNLRRRRRSGLSPPESRACLRARGRSRR